MSKLAAFTAEILRLLFLLMMTLFLLMMTLFLLGSVERWIFKALYGMEGDMYTAAAGNLLVFFVMYRNVWQFKGWYKSVMNRKLKPVWTRALSIFALLLILLPFTVPWLL